MSEGGSSEANGASSLDTASSSDMTGDSTLKTSKPAESSSATSSKGGNTTVDITSYIRNTTAKNYTQYKKDIAAYKLSDPAQNQIYTAAQKEEQMNEGRTMSIRVQKAIMDGKNHYKVEPGVYRFANGMIPFEFTGVKNFYLDIRDCTFILEGTQNLIKCAGCQNVIVQGPATVDRDPMLVTQFEVISYNETAKQLTVRLMEGYSLPEHVKTSGGNFQWFTKEGEMLPTSFISYSNAQMTNEAAREAVFNGVACNRELCDDARLVKGQIGSTAVSGHVAQVIGLSSSRNIQIRDITNYGGGMMTLITNEYGPDTLDKLYNIRKPGTNRLVAGTAGQMEYIESGVTITNCVFSFCEDDVIDIMGHSHFVYEQESSDTIIIKPMGTYVPMKKGDTINIFDAKNFNKKITSKVVSFETIQDDALMNAARDSAIGSYGYMSSMSKSYCVRVKLDKKVTIKKGDTFENETSFRPKDVVVRNNYFHDYGCRVLIQGCDGLLIENNMMDRAGLAAIAIDMEEAAWTEGPSSKNVTIRNNTITDSPCSPYVTHWPFVLNGAISVGPSQFYDYRTPCTDPNIFSNINITGNKIYNSNYSAILVKNANGVKVTGNYIENAVTNTVNTRRPEASGVYIFGEEPLYGVYLFGCAGITDSGNTFKNMGKASLGNIRRKDCK